MGSPNENVLFSGGMGRGRPRSKHKNTRVNIQMTYVRPHINKYPRFSIVLHLRVSRSLHSPTNYYILYNIYVYTYTQGEYGKISLVLIESNWLQIRISNYVASKEVFFATK